MFAQNSLETANSLGRIEGYTFCFRPGALDDPNTIKDVWLTLPGGLTARFVRFDDWERLTPETVAESTFVRVPETAESPALASTSFSPSHENRSQ
jgi:hypothetical protein